ncbi:MAG: LuxR C-terminal-related transcriptional regulator [Ferruginibacter sp.]
MADKLFLSKETVRTHIRNIYEKLQANSRLEALKKTGLL